MEALIGGALFFRDRKHVELSDAGRAYVQQARLSLLYGERAVQSARAVIQGLDETFHVGRTPYADPFLVSTLLSIRLSLFPRLKLDLASKFSIDIVHDLLAGVVDLAIAHEPPESPLLTCIQVAEQPFYIAMAKRDDLVPCSKETTWKTRVRLGRAFMSAQGADTSSISPNWTCEQSLPGL